MEQVHQAFVATGEWLEPLDAGELAFVGAVAAEGVAKDDLDGAPSAHDVLGQPDLAVAALANAANKSVVGPGGG